MKFIYVTFFALSSTLFAATHQYDVKVDVKMNGEPFAHSSLSVKEGEEATVISKTGASEKFVEVTAVEDTSKVQDGIRMKLAVGYIDENGGRTIISRPEVIMKNNSMVEITSGDKDDLEAMKMSVIATKKSL